MQQRVKVFQPVSKKCRKRARYAPEEGRLELEGGRILALKTRRGSKSDLRGATRPLNRTRTRPREPRWGKVSYRAAKVHRPAAMFVLHLAHQPPAPLYYLRPLRTIRTSSSPTRLKPLRGRRTEKACGLCRRPRIKRQHLDVFRGGDVWRGCQRSGLQFIHQ